MDVIAFSRTGLALACAVALPLLQVSAATAQTAAPPATTSAPLIQAQNRAEVELPSGVSAPSDEAAAPGLKIPGTGLTVTGLGSTGNDYLFRGISQTRNNWAFQGAADIAHESGVYVGTFVSNAKFLANPWNDTQQEVDALAGYRFTVKDVNFDIGWIGYFYPGQNKAPGTQLNEYQEAALKVNYTIDKVKLLGAFNFSPNWFGHSGKGYYLEGGADVTLPWEFTASGRLGYQWIEKNAVFGTPDYLWYSIGVAREIIPGTGITGSLAWYGTNISKSQCIPLADRATGGQRVCEGRVLFTLTKTF